MMEVSLEGGRVATYEVIGRGAPTLMLPGGPGFASAYMRGTAELFADVFESHLIDPHGSGGSSPPPDPAAYSPEGHARFYEEVRSALGLGPVTVFGHSFGGTTALTYAALFPGSVRRCIAAGAFGMGTEHDKAEGGESAAEMEAMLGRHASASWYPAAKSTWDAWTERILATSDPSEAEAMMAAVLPLYTAHPDRPEVAAGLQEFARHLTADLTALKAWEGGLYQGIDLRPLLGRIEAPTLVVAGELDPICGPAQARPIAGAVKNSTIALISDCGHMLTEESPRPFKAAVVAWLEGPGRSSPDTIGE